MHTRKYHAFPCFRLRFHIKCKVKDKLYNILYVIDKQYLLESEIRRSMPSVSVVFKLYPLTTTPTTHQAYIKLSSLHHIHECWLDGGGKPSFFFVLFFVLEKQIKLMVPNIYIVDGQIYYICIPD